MTPKVKVGKLLALALCIALCAALAVFMTVDVVHIHADGAVNDAHCQLCASAHVAIDTQPAWLTGYVLRLIEAVRPGDVSPGQPPVVVTAFIRPPPSFV